MSKSPGNIVYTKQYPVSYYISYTCYRFKAEDCVEDVPDFAPLGNFQITPELQLKYVRHESRNHDVFPTVCVHAGNF